MALLMSGKKCGAKNGRKLSRDETTSYWNTTHVEIVAENADFGIQKQQCRKHMDRWAKRNEQLKIEMERAQAEMEDFGQNSQAESLLEVELDLEIREFKAGEGRRGSDASQSNGCFMDLAFLQYFFHVRSRFGQTAAFTSRERVRKVEWNAASARASYPDIYSQKERSNRKRGRRNRRRAEEISEP